MLISHFRIARIWSALALMKAIRGKLILTNELANRANTPIAWRQVNMAPVFGMVYVLFLSSS